MGTDIIGRLKRTLPNRCPSCGYTLQLRSKEVFQVAGGVEISTEEEYILCSNCGHTETTTKKTKASRFINKENIRRESESGGKSGFSKPGRFTKRHRG